MCVACGGQRAACGVKFFLPSCRSWRSDPSFLASWRSLPTSLFIFSSSCCSSVCPILSLQFQNWANRWELCVWPLCTIRFPVGDTKVAAGWHLDFCSDVRPFCLFVSCPIPEVTTSLRDPWCLLVENRNWEPRSAISIPDTHLDCT